MSDTTDPLPPDPGTITPPNPPPPVDPTDTLIADAQALKTVHQQYDAARAVLVKVQGDQATLELAVQADLDAAHALADQKRAAAQAVVDQAQHAADDLHAKVQADIAQVLVDAQALGT